MRAAGPPPSCGENRDGADMQRMPEFTGASGCLRSGSPPDGLPPQGAALVRRRRGLTHLSGRDRRCGQTDRPGRPPPISSRLWAPARSSAGCWPTVTRCSRSGRCFRDGFCPTPRPAAERGIVAQASSQRRRRFQLKDFSHASAYPAPVLFDLSRCGVDRSRHPSVGSSPRGRAELTTRRPYPNNHYAACRKRGLKAIGGIRDE